MITEFLQRYNYTEERYLAWLKSQGMNPQLGIALIVKYSKEGRDFRSGDALCAQLMQDLTKAEVDSCFSAITEPRSKEEKTGWRKLWGLIAER